MEPWFDPRTAGQIGGLIGTRGGLTGAVVGCSCALCARKGWKKPIYAIFIAAIAIGAALLLAGAIALCSKQPHHVLYSFLLPGFLLTVIFSSLFPMVRKRFVEGEIRKMQAKDI